MPTTDRRDIIQWARDAHYRSKGHNTVGQRCPLQIEGTYYSGPEMPMTNLDGYNNIVPEMPVSDPNGFNNTTTDLNGRSTVKQSCPSHTRMEGTTKQIRSLLIQMEGKTVKQTCPLAKDQRSPQQSWKELKIINQR